GSGHDHREPSHQRCRAASRARVERSREGTAVTVAPTVRRASQSDVPALARMLARAFLDDPVASWSCRPDALRPAMLERFHVTRLRQRLADEEVWTTPDLKPAALWAPPRRWKMTPRQDAAMAACLVHPRLVVRLPLVAAGLLGIERRHPTHPPHFYLAVLGTD